MNVVKEIQRINQRELATSEGWDDGRSWHAQYKDTSWIFVANLDYELTEGDVVCIFSQYGEPLNIEMARDQKTGKSMGFAFLQYENQKSSVLAVDNMNGSSVLSRTLRVDHSYGPKKKRRDEDDDNETYAAPVYNVAPPSLDVTDDAPETPSEKKSMNDEEDPMAAYFQKKKRKEEKKKKKSSKDHSRHHHRKEKSSDRGRHRYDDNDDSYNEFQRKDSQHHSDQHRKRKYSSDSR